MQLMSLQPIIFRLIFRQSRSLREFLHLDYLNKEEAIYVDRIINKYSDLFRMSR